MRLRDSTTRLRRLFVRDDSYENVISFAFHRALVLAALAACLAAPVAARAATLSGVVFEDVNYGGGPGRDIPTGGAVGISGVRVEIYNGNAFEGAVTTVAGGVFTYSYGGHAPRTVRVVSGTVRSSRPGGSTCTTCVPVQTFRTSGSGGGVAPETNRVGGETPGVSDAGSNTTGATLSSLTTLNVQTAQSITTVNPSTGSSAVTNINFGFSFSTIVNRRDASNCAPSGGGTFFPCQGSLRQFIINANALGGEGSLAQAGEGQLDGNDAALPSGFDSSIFMIPSAALSGGVGVIQLASALPTLTSSNTRLDATTQTVNSGNTNSGTVGTGGTVGVDNLALPTFQRPEIQIDGTAGGVITLSGANTAIHGFALRQAYIALTGANGVARNNLIGMTATGLSNDNSPTAYGVTFSGPNATIRSNYVTVNNSGIRSDGGGANAVISFNEVARPSAGHSSTFDGILLINGANNVQITGNLVRNQAGGGIELGFGSPGDSYVNVTVANNTASNNGFANASGSGAASAEPIGMVAYNFTGTNVLFYRNRVANNAGPGLIVMAATGVAASQNRFENNGGLAIDLDPNTRDPNNLGAPNGVTLNDANDADAGPNGLLNYAVVRSAAIVNGELILSGFARPNSSLEVYLAQADPSGFGEGQTYLTVLTEGSAADLDATTGAYGPGAVNGVAQGTDTTNRFSFRLPVPAGVAIGSILTSTATLNGQTSEFGGNVVVTGGPSLIHLKSVAVVSDPVNNQSNPKSIPGALQLYTLRLTNQGAGGVDSNSIMLTDPVPPNTALHVLDIAGAGSGPVAFVDGSPSSGLTYTFTSLASTTDSVEFSNDGGVTWTYTPVANANGVDPAVTHIRVRPQGAMAGASGGNPWFEVRFRVRVL